MEIFSQKSRYCWQDGSGEIDREEMMDIFEKLCKYEHVFMTFFVFILIERSYWCLPFLGLPGYVESQVVKRRAQFIATFSIFEQTEPRTEPRLNLLRSSRACCAVRRSWNRDLGLLGRRILSADNLPDLDRIINNLMFKCQIFGTIHLFYRQRGEGALIVFKETVCFQM